MKLAIVTSHPIQYNAPFFRELNEHPSIEPHVFFTQTSETVRFDPDFNREVKWDVNLTDGYRSEQHEGDTSSGKSILIQRLKELAPDAILMYGWNVPGHLSVMRAMHGTTPIWFRGDSHLLDPLPFWKRLARKLLLTWIYRHVDHCFTVGTHNEDYFLWCGIRPRQLSRAPHAIDHVWFEQDHEKRTQQAQEWRKKLDIPLEAKVILFAGKLEPKKEPELLIRAWQNLMDENTHLVIAGSGILEDTLKLEFGHIKHLHFVGFQNQSAMPILYRMADVFCLPSKGPGETWGLAVNEALSCGVPCVVSTMVGCANDILTSPALGSPFQSGDQTALSEALRQQLSSPPPDNEALQAYRSQFSFSEFTQQILTQWKAIHP